MSSTTLIIYITLCGIVASIGSNRKIGYWGAFLISLIIGPLFGLIIVLLFKKNKKYELENLISIAQQFDSFIIEEYEHIKKFLAENIITKKEYILSIEQFETKIDELFYKNFGLKFNEMEKSKLNKYIIDGLINDDKIIYNKTKKILKKVGLEKWQKIKNDDFNNDWIIIKEN